MSGHTEGPWHVEGEWVLSESGSTIASVFDGDGLRDDTNYESLAGNLDLIAAAPDLLEALQALVKAAIFHGVEDTQFGAISLSQAQEAIARAKGESK